MLGIPISLWCGALVLEALLLAALTAASGPWGAAGAIPLLLLTYSVYIFAVFCTLHLVPGNRRGRLLFFVLATGIVFRITAWPIAAPFTDDLYRYRWEARLQAHGGNPYITRPIDPQWDKLRDDAYERIPLKEFRGGHGPLWQLLISGWYSVVSRIESDPVRQVHWFKAPAAVFDVLTVAVLLLLLRARDLPLERVLVYAWSPLPIWEFWASGHQDSLLTFFLVGCFCAHALQRTRLAFACLFAAVAVKYWPVLLVPALLLRSRGGWWTGLLSGTLLVAATAAPYWADVGENLRFMSGFVGGWRNNDSLFGVILWLAGDQYLAKYTAFALIGAAALWLATRGWPLEKVALATIVALLALSSNVHPWYLTWFLPILALIDHPPLLLWTALMPLCYSVWIGWSVVGDWDGSSAVRWYVYLPVVLFAVWWSWRNRRMLASGHGSTSGQRAAQAGDSRCS